MLSNGERKERNSKLENFLRRKLKPNVYGDVRWYEPIVLRKEDSLSYKQVVITGEEILLVDTPPKEITTLLSINTITAVLMVHDLPEFLEGGLRDRTTHVLLKVKNDSTISNLSQKTRRASTSTLKNIQQRKGSLDRTISEETSSNDGQNEDVFDVNLKKAKWRRHLERRSSREILSFSSVDLEKLSNLSMQHSSKFVKMRPPLIRGVTVPDAYDIRARSLSNLKGTNGESEAGSHNLSLGEMPTNGSMESGLSPLYGLKSEFGTRPISPALCEVLNRVESKCFTPNGRSLTPDFSRGQSLPRSVSAFETYHSPSVSTALRSRSVLDKPLNLHSGTFPRRSQSSHNLHLVDVAEEDEVHLYTLSTSTHLFHLLHSLWMASMLTPLDELSDLNACLQLNQEGIDQTFRSLCSDLQEAGSIEEHYSLLQDLFQGIKKYSNVRRVFWRDTEALCMIRELMRDYCNSKSFNDENDTAAYFDHRGNELKIVILILRIIKLSLNRSQGCPYKSKAFRNKSLLEELLTEVFMVPEILPPHNLMVKRFLCNFKQLSENSWQLLPERELLEIIQKMIDASVMAAFQIIEAIFEIGWSDSHKTKSKSRKSEQDSTSLSILLQFVPVDDWLSYAMPKLLLLVQPRSKECEEAVKKEDLILIYQYLAVLLALLKQSPKALAFCIANYSEELRYYVNESVLKRKLDAFDPLTPHTFRLAKSILKLILR